MKYMGKISLKKPCLMRVIADKLMLEELTTFETQDMVGTVQWRGGPILMLLHLSWGNMDDVRKARIYAHHIPDTERDEFWKFVMERLGEVAQVEE